MKKILLLTLLTAMSLMMTSCRNAVENARRNIRIEAVEKIERHGMTGADLTLRVKNDTRHKLALHSARLDLYYGTSRVARLQLRDGVELMRRTTASVDTRWQIKIWDPLALYALVKKIEEDDISQVSVSYEVEGKGGPAKVSVSQKMVPLSEFLNIFGLSMERVMNYLKE